VFVTRGMSLTPRRAPVKASKNKQKRDHFHLDEWPVLQSPEKRAEQLRQRTDRRYPVNAPNAGAQKNRSGNGARPSWWPLGAPHRRQPAKAPPRRDRRGIGPARKK